MAIEQLAEVGLAQPAVDARTHLDADDLRDDRGAAEPRGEIDLTEAPFAEQTFDAVLQARLWTRDDAIRHQQLPRPVGLSAKGSDGTGRSDDACFTGRSRIADCERSSKTISAPPVADTSASGVEGGG
jgi:hypothetical protein